MKKYNGVPCPVCEKPFTDTDDLVVCPDCGAPCHRECYAVSNKCVFSQSHQDGFRWQPPAAARPEPVANQVPHLPTRYCLNCDMPLDPGLSECKNCGCSVGTPDTDQTTARNAAFRFISDPLSYVDPEEQAGEDVSMRDMARLVGVNVPYYIGVFGQIHRTKHGRFNFAALFFSGFWLLHRKQYLLGGIVTFLTSGMTLMLNYLFGSSISQILNGLDSMKGVTDIYSTPWFAMGRELSSLPIEQTYPIYLWSLLGMVAFAVSVFLGVYGNRLYYNACLKKIRHFKQQKLTTEEYHASLSSHGGVNMLLSTTLYFILQFFPGLPQ